MGSEVSLEVGTLEVRLLAPGEVTHVVPPAGKVGLRRAAVLPRRHVNRSWRQGEELGVAQGHDLLCALGGLRHGALGHHEHHGALGDRGAH